MSHKLNTYSQISKLRNVAMAAGVTLSNFASPHTAKSKSINNNTDNGDVLLVPDPLDIFFICEVCGLVFVCIYVLMRNVRKSLLQKGIRMFWC